MDISKAKTSLKRPHSDTATGGKGAEKQIKLENHHEKNAITVLHEMYPGKIKFIDKEIRNDNNPEFEFSVEIEGKIYSKATAKTKKVAKKMAAEATLQSLKQDKVETGKEVKGITNAKSSKQQQQQQPQQQQPHGKEHKAPVKVEEKQKVLPKVVQRPSSRTTPFSGNFGNYSHSEEREPMIYKNEPMWQNQQYIPDQTSNYYEKEDHNAAFQIMSCEEIFSLAGITTFVTKKGKKDKYFCTYCEQYFGASITDLTMLQKHCIRKEHLHPMANKLDLHTWQKLIANLYQKVNGNQSYSFFDSNTHNALEMGGLRQVDRRVLYCRVCETIISFENPDVIKNHISGKKHAKKMKILSMEDFDSNQLSMALENCNNDSEIPAEYVEDSGRNPNNFNPTFGNAGQLSGNVDQWDEFQEKNTDFGFREFHNNPKNIFGDNESMHHDRVNYEDMRISSQKGSYENEELMYLNEELQKANEEIKRIKREATDEIKKLRMEIEYLREENLQLKMKKLTEEAYALREENKKLKELRTPVTERLPPSPPPPPPAPAENLNIRELRQENQQIKNTNTQQHGNNQHSRRYIREIDEVHHENQSQKLGVGRGLSNAEREPAFSWNNNNKNNNKWNIGEKEKGYYDKGLSRDGSHYDKPSTSTGSKYDSHDKSFNTQFSSKYEERRDGGQYGSFTFSNLLQVHSKPNTHHGNNRPFNDYNESGMMQGSKGEGYDQWGYQNHSMTSSTPYHSNMQNASVNQSTHQQRDTRGIDFLSSKPTMERKPYF